MVDALAGADHDLSRRAGDEWVEPTRDVVLLAGDLADLLAGGGIGDHDVDDALAEPGAGRVLSRLDDPFDHLVGDRLIGEVADHAPLADDIDEFHDCS